MYKFKWCFGFLQNFSTCTPMHNFLLVFFFLLFFFKSEILFYLLYVQKSDSSLLAALLSLHLLRNKSHWIASWHLVMMAGHLLIIFINGKCCIDSLNLYPSSLPFQLLINITFARTEFPEGRQHALFSLPIPVRKQKKMLLYTCSIPLRDASLCYKYNYRLSFSFLIPEYGELH